MQVNEMPTLTGSVQLCVSFRSSLFVGSFPIIIKSERCQLLILTRQTTTSDLLLLS
jgi:hypothetical protein